MTQKPDIATWLMPTPEIQALIEQGLFVSAIARWRRLPHRLLDGTRVIPSAKVGKSMILQARSQITMLREIPLLIQEGEYTFALPDSPWY